jgi:ubiquitin carboxyl-terminal hydrolase 10
MSIPSYVTWLGPDIMAPAAAGKPALSARYTLYGVLYHHGPSAIGGHYTVNVLHQSSSDGSGGGDSDDWLHIDDEIVSAVRHEDIWEI